MKFPYFDFTQTAVYKVHLQTKKVKMHGGKKIEMVLNLSFSSPHAVASWKSNGAEAIDGDTEDGVDGTEAGRVIQRQPEIT